MSYATGGEALVIQCTDSGEFFRLKDSRMSMAEQVREGKFTFAPGLAGAATLTEAEAGLCTERLKEFFRLLYGKAEAPKLVTRKVGVLTGPTRIGENFDVE